MKRILAILNSKMDSIKKERKMKRLFRAIDICSDNAEEAIEQISNKIDDLADTLSTTDDLNKFVQNLSDLIGEKEEQMLIIERLKKVKSYLEEDIDVPE